ncbi:MAG TPA: BTAD domain-containing putative transcriptional regulator [Actinocrinis sp.]|nr:BTAD domain-containing putative transcriptional regulator [Actinocrinis sp.]
MEVWRRDGIVRLGGPRQQVVMAMLLLEANRVIPVDRLSSAIWGEDPPTTSRGQVQISISSLRRQIIGLDGRQLIDTRGPGYLISVADGELDSQLFEARVAAGRAALADGDPTEAAAQLRAGLALWRGPALSGIASRLVQRGVAELDERRMQTLEECLTYELQLGRHHDLIGELARLVEEHPLRENLRALFMTALYRAGRQAEALEAYRHTRDVLMEELGIEPGRQLRQLHHAILNDAPLGPADRAASAKAAAPAPAPSPAAAGSAPGPAAGQRRSTSRSGRTAPGPEQFPVRDGQRVREAERRHGRDRDRAQDRIRTHDIHDRSGRREPRPEPDDEPVPTPLRAQIPRLLPATIPDFTGRSRILDRIIDELTDPGLSRDTLQAVPISVIVGQGGAGKTTLAVHVAHRMAERFPDGQLFARLRTGDRPTSPADVLERFLRALGATRTVLPEGVEERAEMYRDLLGKRRMLIVLDDAMSEQQITALLPGNSQCSVIVTSRKRLTGLPSAGRIEVGGFSPHSAVELLTRLVGKDRIEAEPESVTALCTQCGYLPLALRIVAARLAARPHWSVTDLLERLVDESRRLDELNHGEMGVRASISLTYESLSPDARRLFRRLSLLEASSFPSWVGAPLLRMDPLPAQDLLEELAEAYLLDIEPGNAGAMVRYRFHDITKPFARERLVAEESPTDRHQSLEDLLGALLFLSGQAHRREYSGDFMQLRSRASRWRLPEPLVDRLLENPLAWYENERLFITAAVHQAAASGLIEHAWDLALSAVALFESHTYFGDWRETHEVALKASCRAGDRWGEAAMRYSLGSLHMFEQQPEQAGRQFTRAHELYLQLGDRHGVALVLRNLAYLDRMSGHLEKAMARWEEALDTLRVVGDRIAEAHVLQNMAQVRLDFGEDDTARGLLEQAAEICRELGNRRVGAQVQHRLGELYLRHEEFDRAAESFGRVLAAVRESEDRVGECYALIGLAGVDLGKEDFPAATARLAQARLLAGDIGERMVESRVALVLAELELRTGRPTAAEHADRAVRGFEEMRAAQLQARSLFIRGQIHLAAGCPVSALADWQSAAAVLAGLSPRGAGPLAAELERSIEALEQDPGRPAAEPGHPPGVAEGDGVWDPLAGTADPARASAEGEPGTRGDQAVETGSDDSRDIAGAPDDRRTSDTKADCHRE